MAFRLPAFRGNDKAEMSGNKCSAPRALNLAPIEFDDAGAVVEAEEIGQSPDRGVGMRTRVPARQPTTKDPAELDWNSTGAQIVVESTGHFTDATKAANGALHQLFHSDANPANSLGNFPKFATPIVANGKVFTATFSNKVVEYGL